jgi:hypothetical protein
MKISGMKQQRGISSLPAKAWRTERWNISSSNMVTSLVAERA